MNDQPPAVLLIGDLDHHEFAEPIAWLGQHTRLTAVASIDAALTGARSDEETWHTVILASARPGRFSPRDVARLGRAYPLTPFVALLGSLCEGETRSGQPWPGVVRVYWHQWWARCEAELRAGTRPTSWQLPRTASDVERLETLLHTPPSGESGLVAVFTRSGLLFDGLSRACAVAGFSSAWVLHTRRRCLTGVAAVIWDVMTYEPNERGSGRHIATLLPRVPVLALMGFPRHDQIEQLRSQGVHRVLSLPLLLPDLWEALRELTT